MGHVKHWKEARQAAGRDRETKRRIEREKEGYEVMRTRKAVMYVLITVLGFSSF